MTGFIVRTLVTAVALWVADLLVRGIWFDSLGTLLLAAILFGLVNAFVRPVVVILSLPLTILTLGLFLLVVNAAMLGLTAALLPGMHVSGFWAALFGGIVVWIVSWIVSGLTAGLAD